MTDKELMRHLNKQHPSPWTTGAWYPATLPNGNQVEIKRTNGRGKNNGRYLHVRFLAPFRVRSPNGSITSLGNQFVCSRFNLETGEWKAL